MQQNYHTQEPVGKDVHDAGHDVDVAHIVLKRSRRRQQDSAPEFLQFCVLGKLVDWGLGSSRLCLERS